jgi:hypothetical protein
MTIFVNVLLIVEYIISINSTIIGFFLFVSDILFFVSRSYTSPNGFKIRCHVNMMTRLLLCYRGRLQP